MAFGEDFGAGFGDQDSPVGAAGGGLYTMSVTTVHLPTSPMDVLIVDVYDTLLPLAEGYSCLLCLDNYPATGERLVIWDGSFRTPFEATISSVTGLGSQASPYRFTIRPLAGWSRNVNYSVVALGQYGPIN